MKILHINTTDIEGGAARAAYRLHRALLDAGIDSQMLVQNKLSDDYTILGPTSKIEKIINKIRPFLDRLPLWKYKNKTKTPFSPAWLPSNVVKKINKLNPDIVHLHWIAGGMIRIEELAKIKAPIVWTLHDMWAFTGGEHIDEGQKHYIDRCGNSKVLNSNKENDLSREGWRRKKKTYDRIGKFWVISPSRWIQKEAQKSSLLKDKNHALLPNPIDTNLFKPIDKKQMRELWGLPQDKKMILFGAMSATSDPNKGYDLLKESLNFLSFRKDVEIVVFGSSEPKQKENINIPITYVGRLHDNQSLVSLYGAVDVMIVPSKQENLVQTAIEAMACGIPVVAFNVTGQPDIIDHKLNGYLADPFDTADLKNGIEWVLDNENYQQLSKNAREKVINTFSEEVLIPEFVELYKQVINERK